MGKRLTRITTRTGDDGSTGLGNGARVSKTSARIQAIGDVDELNSTIGVLLTETLPADVQVALSQIQHDLFDLGGELSIPSFEQMRDEQLERLDGHIASYNAKLSRLSEFILPGGSRAAAFAHVSRTVCRRAERSVVALGAVEQLRPLCRQYLNRLSDLLFILARVANQDLGVGDVMWNHQRARP